MTIGLHQKLNTPETAVILLFVFDPLKRSTSLVYWIYVKDEPQSDKTFSHHQFRNGFAFIINKTEQEAKA